MKSKKQRFSALMVISIFVLFALGVMIQQKSENVAIAQENTKKSDVSSKTPDDFDQKAAIAKLREQIKGKEEEPAEKVFKNIQIFKGFPAGRILAIMEFGFSRSLGVNCTHCHTPENWASEVKSKKQIARDMWNMQMKINGELLASIEGIKRAEGERPPVVNCTTCHRGDTKPATNLDSPKPENKKDDKSEVKNEKM